MSDKVDDFVQEIKDQIFEETKEAFGEAAYQRWLNPLYKGSVDDPDGYASLQGRCGDTIEIYLKFNGEQVDKAAFQTDGCGAITVCGSFAAEMAIGKTPEEILEITGEAIIEKLGGIPKEEAHCASLASETLQEALNNYMIKQT
ncbi:MAG: iron-sulfur cluster assembly scaffold protein [Desulfobacteraceae bacterium]